MTVTSFLDIPIVTLIYESGPGGKKFHYVEGTKITTHDLFRVQVYVPLNVLSFWGVVDESYLETLTTCM